MPSYKKQLVFLLLSLIICVVFIFSIYGEIKKRAIEELNSRQTVYARLAAQGLAADFSHKIETLHYLAQNEHIIRLDQQGKDLMRSIQKITSGNVAGVSRLNAQGRITFSWPGTPGTTGKDISTQDHVREILKKRRPVISEIFKSVQGFEAIAIHVPVYRGKTFDGTVAFLLAFDELAKKYLDNIHLPGYRHAQLISATGRIIYCPGADHQGRLASEVYGDSPGYIEMLQKMLQGREGVATYVDHTDTNRPKSMKKHAVYRPVRVGDTHWSILVSTSEDILLALLKGLRNQILVLTLLLFIVFAAIAYVAAKIRSESLATQQKRKIEEDLIQRAGEVHDLYNNAPCGYHSLDQDGAIVRINDTELAWLGYAREELIGQSFRLVLTEASCERFETALAAVKEQGLVREVEYDMKRKDGSIINVLVSASAVTDPSGNFIMTRSMAMDITPRRLQEERLRESEELYRTAMETTSDGITITQERKYVYANKKLMQTIGRPDESLIGKTAGIYIHPYDRHLLEENYQATLKGISLPNPNYNVRVLKPDGSPVMVSVINVPIIYQGEPATLAFITDITEQNKYETALRESEELYRTALETTNDGISIVQDGKYVYANQKLLKTIGREDKGLLDMPLGCYTHPDDRNRVRQYHEARSKGESVPLNYDLRVIKSNGAIIVININSVSIIYKGKPATLSFILDITERKKAETALRESEERYRTIIESLDDDYFETDLKGNITFINKTHGWSGHSREELIGMNHSQYTAPEMVKKVSAVFNKVYRNGKAARIVDYEIIRKDGSIAHLEMSISLIRDAKGNPSGFRGISRDVSERFKMEALHRKLTDQLYQAQKMEAIGTLAGGIAHDFNNLLMGIQGYTSLMLLEVDETHPYYEQLQAVQTLVQSGAGLTRQLLGFARAGRYEVIPINLNDFIRKSANLFGRTRKEIRIFEKYEERIWTVEADCSQMEQVLLNMFVNAWQAMPGGGSLYLETENMLLDDASARLYDLSPGRYVKTSITDTGMGMDEKTRQRIFDPFFTTKEMGRGTGLGLASAYGIVRGHGGRISVYSETGQGTTFNIYLPASSKEVFPEAPVESEITGGRETILLVDDEEVITEVTGRLLAELGYTLMIAGSGEEAIALYTRHQARIDLVIIDMIMPGMNGSDTFDALQAVNPSVRAILSSGYSLNGKAQAIMDKGVRVFLQKPYRLRDLAQKIREALL